MRVWYFCLAALLLCLSSCSSKKSDDLTALQSETKIQKPQVALVPLLDTSCHRLNWSVSKEITQGLFETLKEQDHCKITLASKIKHHDPFGADVSWIKKEFSNHEFVIFVLLSEHSEKPSYPTQEVAISDSPTDLKIAFQLRVFDVREEEPKIILQETIEKTQHIPRPFSCFNFRQVAWGDPLYTFSPMGIVHRELIDEISFHIQDYILAGTK